MKRKTALIRSFKLFLGILLASLVIQASAGVGQAAGPRLGTIPQEPAPQLPLQCTNTTGANSNQYCDIRVVLLIDDTGSMRSNDPSAMRNQGARNLVDILSQEYYQLAVDARAADPSVVLPDIKVAVIHFSHCISNNPLDHCISDVKYNSGWLPITQKDGLYTAIDWLKTQPDYYRVSQYTHFIEPFQAASDLFNDPAAASSNTCVHRLMMLLTDGTPEDVNGPLAEPALGDEMRQVKSILQGFLTQPDNSLYVTAFKILPKYWLPTQPYWQDIAGVLDHVSLETSLDGVASRMEKIATSIIGAVSNTIPPIPTNPRQYQIEVLQHVSSLRITYYKLDPNASLALTDPKGNPVIPDGKTVTLTGQGTAIEVWTLSTPFAGTYQVKTSSSEGIITTIPLYSVSAQLVLPSETAPLQQFTDGVIQVKLLDSLGGPVLPTDNPGEVLYVGGSLVQAGQSLPLSLTPNGDQYQGNWMPLTADPAQLQVSLELTDANNNSLWKCSGAAGDLPIDPISVNITPPSACTPVDTTLSVPMQLVNGRTGQNTGIGLPLQWQVVSITQPGGKVVNSSVTEGSAQTGGYSLAINPVVPENILSHVTGSVIVDDKPFSGWTFDEKVPITVCMPQPPPPPPPAPGGGSCSSGPWNYLLWALLVLLLLLLLIRLVPLKEEKEKKEKDKKKFTLPFWILLILILLLVLLWLFLCLDLSLWPLLILLVILLLILLRIRFIIRDDGRRPRRSRRWSWVVAILLILLLALWLIFFSVYWLYLVLMLFILLIVLLVLWVLSRGRNEDEPFPFLVILILLILLASLWLVFFGNFPGGLALILALIWLVILLWLWLIDQDRKWRTSNRSWLVIFVFILLVLTWVIYFNTWLNYLFELLVFLLLIGLAAWYIYLYSNPLWGVIAIVDRRKHLLWSAPLANPDGSKGRSYYEWKFKEPIGTVEHLRIHSWDRRRHGLVLRVRATEGRFTFTRSLERWQDCELEDGFSIIWFEKLPEPKRRPPRKAPAPRPRKRGPKSYNIEEIEGIGPAFAARLRRLGIHTTDDLLKVAATRKGRQELALKSGFSTERILEWVNRADLMRVPGVGSEYSDLLEAGGVDTVKELRRRNAGNLYQALDKVNKRKKLVRRLPTLEEVQAWITSANKMKTIVKY